MSHPYHHALSSERKFGHPAALYLPIHQWFDETKAHVADFRHRALRHHTLGIFEAERIFGVIVPGTNTPTRFVGEQHVREDCAGLIPTPQDWLAQIPHQLWMTHPGKDAPRADPS
jgi:hypothetical protein